MTKKTMSDVAKYKMLAARAEFIEEYQKMSNSERGLNAFYVDELLITFISTLKSIANIYLLDYDELLASNMRAVIGKLNKWSRETQEAKNG